MKKKLHIKKGDTVMLVKNITGSKNISGSYSAKGSTGKVLKVYPDTDRVIIEGINMRIRHQKPSQLYPQGGRVEQEMPIHVSNVMPVDSNGNPTRVGRKQIVDPETGRSQWVRYAKTTGEELD
ncbi:MAG: 50S ribosomal protein L24 [Bacteroidota bacterium]